MLAKLKQPSVDSVLPLLAWRGLLQAYFDFDSGTKDLADQTNWRHLRDFLAQTLPAITARTRFHPAWLEVINTHVNLLSEQPCERYGAAVLAGDESEINRLRGKLQIPENSWFWSRLLRTQVKCLVERGDSEFRDGLARVLGLLSNYGWVRNQALVMLLERYAASAFRSTAHPELRDFALNIWGTPHLERNTGWGQVNPAAKAMVQSWLVVEAIRDFFTILRDSTSSIDEERLNFWLRYQGMIEYFHFALGPDVWKNHQPDYVNFHNKFRQHICRLTNPGMISNNAFIFKIGNYFLVEFSTTGNAFYCYHKDQIPFSLIVGRSLSLNQIKVPTNATLRLTHHAPWESEFERKLQQLGIFPDRINQLSDPDDPYTTAKTLAGQKHFSYQDERANGGALWILYFNSTGQIAERLQQLGFRFYNGRGWWRK